MILSRRRSVLALAGVLLFSGVQAHGLVLFGDETTGTNNLVAPSNGAPWQYVASINGETGIDASGVYLGYGYILTANHVNPPFVSASLNGSVYAIDNSYVPLQIGGADLKLLRILGDPLLQPLDLVRQNDTDTNRNVTFISWGAGKGAEIANQGWQWDNTARVQRWGLNTTLPSYFNNGGLPYIETSFTRGGAIGSFGDDEFSLAIADSGGGLFAQYGNTWRLIGIGALVSTQGQALYDSDLAMAGDTPTRSFFVPVKEYRDEILAAIPEPATASTVLAGAFLLGMRRRRKAA